MTRPAPIPLLYSPHLAGHGMLVDLDGSRELPLQALDRLPSLPDDAPDHVLGALKLLGDALAKLSKGNKPPNCEDRL